MPAALQKMRVKKVGRGEYKAAGRVGRIVKLQPKDFMKHQADPIGAEFDVWVPVNTPAGRMRRVPRG